VLRVGLISDTHGLSRPEALAFLGGSDHIVHGGDAGPRRFRLLISVGKLIVNGRSVSARIVELGIQNAT
jgi:hypothetical protein